MQAPHWRLPLFLALCLVSSWGIATSRCVIDDKQREVCLSAPAQRIATLSPGATELTYAAGAGDQVVAVVAYSDYPPAAQQVPSVGSHTRVDMEKLVALQPDLIIGWVTGNPTEQTQLLENLGFPVFYLEPRRIEQVASTLERLAQLAGTESVGYPEAERFRQGMAALQQRYQSSQPIPVFYQVWHDPIMTVNGEHLIHQIIELCGGVNVFSELPRLIPRLDMESVLAANPETILAGGMGEENDSWLTPWRSFSSLLAVQRNNLFFVPPSLIQRPTPRLLEGTALFCDALETARGRR